LKKSKSANLSKGARNRNVIRRNLSVRRRSVRVRRRRSARR